MPRSDTLQKTSLRRKVILLILLLVILGGLLVAAWMQRDYNLAREESIRQIEDSGGTIPDEEDIEFNAPKEELDHINVLLVGLDDEEDIARTDTIMIAQYRPEDGKAKLVSLMRDSYVSIPGYENNKLNAAFAFGGVELLRQTIKENFDVDLHYYAQVNFDGFVRIVDTLAPEGVEVDVPRRMYYSEQSLTIDFQPGLQTMDGEDALKYVRFRSDYQNDFGRVARQQEMLGILKDKLLSVSGVSRIPKILGSIEPYIQTNISTKSLLSYGRNLFTDPVDEIESLTIPVEGGFWDENYAHAGAVLQLDLEKNKQELHNFLELNSDDTE